MNAQRVALGASTAVVVLAVAAAFWLTGAPATQQQRRLDAERVAALKTLSNALERYRQSHRAWPPAERDLVDGIVLTRLPTDPVSGQPFDFRPLDENRFELCATFARQSRDERPGDFWFHDAGERCFSFDATATSRAAIGGALEQR